MVNSFTTNKSQNSRNKLTLIVDLIIIAGVILGIYFHTLNRPWLIFDENIIYEELIVPIPTSFSEIFEIINSFGLTNNLSSTNYLYTSNTVNRTTLFVVPFLLLLGLFFKKNALYYHCFNLLLHILNTSFVYLILRQCFSNFISLNRLLIIFLTLLWSIHPTHVESVLLTTNAGALLSYLVFFILFYDFLKNKNKNSLIQRKFILPLCFLLPMLLNEYIIALPLVLLAYSFIYNYKENELYATIKKTFSECQPYLIGLSLYLIYFLFSNYKFVQPTILNPSILFLERIFWLFPQIFIHFLKLIFFPKTLSIDQSGFVHLGKSLFDAYSVFCFLFVSSCLFLPLILFLWKKKGTIIVLTTWLFFLSLLPFSQILSPTYCLIAERYLYIPIFFIIFGLAKILTEGASQRLAPTAVLLLSFVFILCLTKSYYRTFDWKDNFSLLKSTIKTSPNYLYRGFRIKTLSDAILESNPEQITEAKQYSIKAQNFFYKALKQLKKEKEKHTNEPFILKSYGLDYNSLIVKSIYLIALKPITDEKEDPKKYLQLFQPYLKYIDNFDARTLELYANLFIKTNDNDKAEKIFLFAYKKFPASLFILESLIRLERETKKNLPLAKKYLTEGLKFYPHSKEILLEALKYYQLENNLPAYTRYSYLYGLRTHSRFAYHEALTGYLTLEQLDKAKKIIDKLIISDPHDPRTLYLSSSYYIKKKNYNQAILLLNQAYSIVQNQKYDQHLAFDITFTLANLYLALRNTQQGIYYAKEALHYVKNNPADLEKTEKLLLGLGIYPQKHYN